MTDAELLRGDGVSLVPVPPGVGLDALPELTGGRAAVPGWPHEDTAAALSFGAGGGWTWLVVDDDGRVVGECGTKTPPVDGTVEIGYGLAAAGRGQGLGTRAIRTLLAWLAARPDVRVVVARVAVDNSASRRLLERLDFLATEQDGDEVVYALDLTGGPSGGSGKVHLSN